MLAAFPSKLLEEKVWDGGHGIEPQGVGFIYTTQTQGEKISAGFVHTYHTNPKNATRQRILPQLITRLDQTTSSVRSHFNGGNKLSSYAHGRHGDDRGDDGDGGGGTLVA